MLQLLRECTYRRILSFAVPAILVLGVRPVSAQTMTTFAGNGSAAFSGDGSFAVNAALNHPKGIAIDSAGNVYLADPDNARVRKVNTSGIISTYAGNGVKGFAGDGGQAVNASLSDVLSVALDAGGNLYLADSSNRRIRKISPDGIITTIAGTGIEGFSGDGGPAALAVLGRPVALVLDSSGNLYYADSTAQRIRRISATGTITTVAGNGLNAFAGDGGLATSASLGFPLGIALDAAGNVYVADADNNRVRKITPGGIISTVAGNGGGGFSGDGGQAINATLNIPADVAVDGAQNLYIADAGNNRIRKVNTTGFISTIAGISSNGFSGDGGSPTLAALDFPWSVAVSSSSGAVFIGDRANTRVRAILPVVSSSNPPTILTNGVVNGASFVKGLTVAPGSLASIFGSDLTASIAIASAVPLPTILGQTSVTFNGILAPLFFVSPTQINAQVPFTISAGAVAVQVTRAGTPGPVQTINVGTFSPGLFMLDQAGTGAVFHAATFTTVTSNSPARAGEALSILVTGLGPVSPAIESGTAPSASRTTTIPTVTIGGVVCTLLYSGLAPGLVSVYQLNVVVPSGLPSGNQVVQIAINGVLSNTAAITVTP